MRNAGEDFGLTLERAESVQLQRTFAAEVGVESGCPAEDELLDEQEDSFPDRHTSRTATWLDSIVYGVLTSIRSTRWRAWLNQDSTGDN
jgi:hypothetical protein